MGRCNFHVLSWIGHFVMPLLPFLASIILTFSSKRLYLFLTEGHHPESDTMLLSMIKSAAFAAPASTLLVQTISFGYVLFIGIFLTTLGVTLPMFITDVHTQEAAFVVFYGSGLSIMFQATFPSVSAFFRANIMSSIVILSLSSVVMATAQQLLAYGILICPRQVLLGVLVFLSVMVLFPAFADILLTSRLQLNMKVEADSLWPIKADSTHDDSESDMLKVPLTARKSSSTANMKYEGLWTCCAILWWAVGVHLSCFTISNKEVSTNLSTVSLVCIISLAAFVVKMLLMERMITAYHTDDSSRTSAGYFALGLLGIASLMLTFYPKLIDVHCYALLFAISLFHQLKPDVSCKIPKDGNDGTGIVSQCCTQLIFTLFAMIIGYFISNLIYYKTVPPGFSRNFSDISLSVLATVMVLVSVRYSIRGDKSSLTTAAASPVSQA